MRNRLIDAAAGTVAAVSANEIGIAYAEGKLDPVSHKVVHAMLGCGLGKATGGGCASGAAGAAIGEAMAEVLGRTVYDGKPITDDDKKNILAAAQIAGIVGASAFGGDVKSAQTAALNAVENNYLTAKDLADIEKKKADCKGDAICLQKANDAAKQLSFMRDMSYTKAWLLDKVGLESDKSALDAALAQQANFNDVAAYVQKLNPDWTTEQVNQKTTAYIAEFKDSLDQSGMRVLFGSMDALGTITAPISASGVLAKKAVEGTATKVGAELKTLRQEYVDAVTKLPQRADQLRASGASSEEIAKILHAERRSLGEQFKALTPSAELEKIYARNIERYGDKLGPTIDWLRANGKSWDEIIESASRTGGKDLGL